MWLLKVLLVFGCLLFKRAHLKSSRVPSTSRHTLATLPKHFLLGESKGSILKCAPLPQVDEGCLYRQTLVPSILTECTSTLCTLQRALYTTMQQDCDVKTSCLSYSHTAQIYMSMNNLGI